MTWYLTRTVARQERTAHYALQKKGYQVYLPLMYKDRRGYSQWQTQALWPGYLFTWIEEGQNDFHDVLRTPSVIGFCTFGDGEDRRYGTISNAEIDAQQALADEHGIHGDGRSLEFRAGDEVETIISGFEHYVGITQKTSGERLNVLFSICGHEKVISLNKRDVRPHYA